MKKIILCSIAILLLTGCSYGTENYTTRTLNNMTYVSKTEIKKETAFIFTQPNGVRRELYWNNYKDSFLVEGKKYDIQFVVDDKKAADRIVQIELSDSIKEEDTND
ncbi:membrane lipoprotein lipid attachment site-containing protein [Domibacillus robiginosus]|uniref:membrane lipoprotein lipid attachment site-containing protein n=1 Tax=Domibacillus robiginosus TaxID=1071054 RepID=UPI00067D6324|nr:membrane lipoprotein lipid attachment site-containing protein [Domibacillus robiginosus]